MSSSFFDTSSGTGFSRFADPSNVGSGFEPGVELDIDIEQFLMEKKIWYKNGRKDLSIKCPFHQEGVPSFFIKKDSGLWHCFSCGRKGNARTLLRAFGVEDIKKYVAKTEKKKVNIVVSSEPDEHDIIKRYKKSFKPYRSKWRNIPAETMQCFNTIFYYYDDDHKELKIVFVVKANGKTVGYNIRSLDEGKKNYMFIGFKKYALYGMDTLDDSPVVFIVEGIHDFLNLWQHGLNGKVLCLMGSKVSDRLGDMLVGKNKKYIVGLGDPDPAGKAMNIALKNISKSRGLKFGAVDLASDPGDLSGKDVKRIYKLAKRYFLGH